MTAPQCSVRAIQRSKSFAGVLYDFLTSNGVTAEITAPSVEIDEHYLDRFDHIFIGVSPVLSLSSNYVYGALSTIAAAENLDPDRLTFFIDSPDPGAIRMNLLAVQKTPSTLFRRFYSGRKEYARAEEDRKIRKNIEGSLERLLSFSQRPTLYPSLPFSETRKFTALLDGTSLSSLIGVNLDFMYLEDVDLSVSSAETWSVDDDKSRWFDQIRGSLKKEYVLMKRYKGATDADVDAVISSSIGSIISPSKSGSAWWSYRYVQSLRRAVPIVTEWRDSSKLGSAWGVIAPSLEEMSEKDRHQIAVDQRNLYLSAAYAGKSTIKSTLESIGIDLHDNASI